jgi:hypothetical protein
MIFRYFRRKDLCETFAGGVEGGTSLAARAGALEGSTDIVLSRGRDQMTPVDELVGQRASKCCNAYEGVPKS